MQHTHSLDFTAQALAAREASAAARWRGLTLELLLGGLIVGSWRACDRTHTRRRSHRSAAAQATVQDWENEGGTPDPCAS